MTTGPSQKALRIRTSKFWEMSLPCRQVIGLGRCCDESTGLLQFFHKAGKRLFVDLHAELRTWPEALEDLELLHMIYVENRRAS